MIGVWRVGTNWRLMVGPQDHAQGRKISTLGVAAPAARTPAVIDEVLHVDAQRVCEIVQTSGKR